MRTLIPFYSSKNLVPDLFSEMESMFDTLPKWNERSFDPAVELSEDDKQYNLSVDLPGLKKEDIKVEMKENTLQISGERQRESTQDKNIRVQRFEKTYGYFSRSFTLPHAIQADKIEAHFENGVLELRIPKAEIAQPRKIQIQ